MQKLEGQWIKEPGEYDVTVQVVAQDWNGDMVGEYMCCSVGTKDAIKMLCGKMLEHASRAMSKHIDNDSKEEQR